MKGIQIIQPICWCLAHYQRIYGSHHFKHDLMYWQTRMWVHFCEPTLYGWVCAWWRTGTICPCSVTDSDSTGIDWLVGWFIGCLLRACICQFTDCIDNLITIDYRLSFLIHHESWAIGIILSRSLIIIYHAGSPCAPWESAARTYHTVVFHDD